MRIDDQFVAHRLRMLQSPAWRALPNNVRPLLDRLELEHLRHAGLENGNLACSYGDFERFGMRRRSIPLAIRQAVALGLLEVTEIGYRAASGFERTSRYRLTYVPAAGALKPTDEWVAIATDDMASAVLSRAAATPGSRGRQRP